MPFGTFKAIWNLLLIVALLYTASVMPYQIAFVDEDTPLIEGINLGLDIFFWFDIFINFISAYERPNGKHEQRLRMIIKHYLKTWFIIDFISTFPTKWFEYLVNIDEEEGQ